MDNHSTWDSPAWLLLAVAAIFIAVVATYRFWLWLARERDRNPNELVTLATYRFSHKARMTQWLLQQQGLHVFLSNANVVDFDWFLGTAVGNVKLQVPRSEAEAAIGILQVHPGLLDTTEGQIVDDSEVLCLECGAQLPDEAQQCPACGWAYGESADG